MIENFSSLKTEMSEMRTKFENKLSNLKSDQNIKFETLIGEYQNHIQGLESIKKEVTSLKVGVEGLKNGT